MNWNRPRGGYETESWRRDYSWVDNKPKPKPKIDLGKCSSHRADVRVVKYHNLQPVLWCCECNKHLLSLSWSDFYYYRRQTKNML